MKLSEKYDVPPRLRLLYDFVNSLDQRRYIEDGAAHAGGDEIETPQQLETWMRERGLLQRAEHVNAGEHRAALQLRQSLRDFLFVPPDARHDATQAARQLTAASRKYALTLAVTDRGAVELVPSPESKAMGIVLTQMIRLSETGQLPRLKTCASDECHWIFFDRSKPGNRHWCSSSICGNRQKTRAYRERQRASARQNR